MSARRLGRLLGSVLMLAALVGGTFAVGASQTPSSGYDWGAASLAGSDTEPTDPSGYDWG